MDRVLLNLVLALATNELLHVIMEITNARLKVKRLDAYIHKRAWKELRFNINTRAKAYAISLIAFFIFVLPLWGLYSWLSLPVNTSLYVLFVLLILSYGASMVLFDAYHVDIEKVTKPFKAKSN